MQWNRRCARFSLSGLESGISGLISLAPNNGIKVKNEPQGVGSLSINEGREGVYTRQANRLEREATGVRDLYFSRGTRGGVYVHVGRWDGVFMYREMGCFLIPAHREICAESET